MTDTEEQLRELAAKAMYMLGDPTGEGIPWEEQTDEVRHVYLRRTDAVTPVIRRQVAEEIADKITALCQVHPSHFPWTVLGADSSGTRTARNVRDAVAAQAAAIARSHSQHPEET